MNLQPVTYIQVSDPLKETLKSTVETLADIVEDVAIIVWLVDKEYDQLVVKAQLNAGHDLEDKFKLCLTADDFVVQSFNEAAIQERDDLSKVLDSASTTYAKHRRWMSALACPLKTAESRFGVVTVYTVGYRGFTTKARRQIQSFADLMAMTLENQQRAEQIEGLFTLTSSTTNFMPLQQTLTKIAEVVKVLLEAKFVDIYPWNNETAAFEPEFSVIYPPIETPLPVPTPGGVSYQTLKSPTPIEFNRDETPELFTELENQLDIQSFWGVRMMADHEPVGVFHVNYAQRREYSEKFTELLTTVANNAAIAVREARFFEQMEYQADAFKRLSRVSQTLTTLKAPHDYRGLLQEIVDDAQEVLEADTIVLYEYNQTEDRFELPEIRTGKHLVEDTLPGIPETSLLHKFIELENPNYVQNTKETFLTEERPVQYQDYPEDRYAVREGIVSAAVVPLAVEEQKAGLLFVNYRSAQPFSDAQKNVIESFAGQAAIAIRNARLYENISHKAKQLEQARKVTEAVHRELDIHNTLQNAIDGLATLLNVQQAALILFDKQTGRSQLAAEYITPNCPNCVPAEELVEKISLRDTQPVKWLKEHKDPIKASDIETHPILKTVSDLAKMRHTVSVLILPLISQTDELIGAVTLETVSHQREFSDEEVEWAQLIINQTIVAYENAQLFERIDQRNKNLTALSEIGQQLTSSPDRQRTVDIIKLISQQAQNLIGTQDITVALYNAETEVIEFKFALINGQEVNLNDRKYNPQKRGKTDEIIRSGKSILHKTLAESKAWYEQPDRREPPGYVQASFLGVPMAARGRVLGVLAISNREKEYVFDEQDRQIVESIANQAAIALDNARLYYDVNQQLQRRVAGLNALNQVGQTLSSHLRSTEPEIIELIYEQAQALTQCKHMYIALYDDSRNELRFPLYLESGRRGSVQPRPLDPDNRGRTEEIILSKEPILIKTKQASIEWYNQPGREEFIGNPLTSWLGVPMIVADKAIGVIAVFDPDQEFVYDETHRDIFSAMANQAAIALDNARLYYDVNQQLENANQQLQRRVASLNALNQVGQTLSSQLRATEPEIIELIYEQAQAVTQCKHMYIALYDDSRNELRFPLYLERGRRGSVPPRPLDPDNRGRTEEIILSKEPILIKTKQASIEWYNQPGRQEFIGKPLTSWLGVPMIVADKAIGVIAVFDPDQEFVYDETDLDIFSAMANQAAIALDNARLYYDVNQQLQRQVEGLDTLNQVGRNLSSRIRATEPEIIELIYQEAQKLTQCEDMYIALYDEETNEIRYPLYQERSQRKTLSPTGLDAENRGRTAEIILTQTPLMHKTRQEAENWYNQPGRQVAIPIISASWLGVPMIVEDKVIGAIVMRDIEREYTFDEIDFEILSALSSQAAIALNNVRLYEETSRLRRTAVATQQLGTLGVAFGALQHRISNTFNIIVPNVTRLRKRIDHTDGELNRILDIIERNARYTSDIISRIQEPLKQIDIQTVDINAILDDTLKRISENWRTDSTDPDVVVVFEPDESLPLINASSGQLAEVFRNLFDNAYRAMNESGQLTVTSHLADNVIQIKVKDTGDGIPPVIKERLFSKPVPSKELGGGAGLGLWLSQLILQSIGGKIVVDESSSRGTTMLVEIPLDKTERGITV